MNAKDAKTTDGGERVREAVRTGYAAIAERGSWSKAPTAP